MGEFFPALGRAGSDAEADTDAARIGLVAAGEAGGVLRSAQIYCFSELPDSPDTCES